MLLSIIFPFLHSYFYVLDLITNTSLLIVIVQIGSIGTVAQWLPHVKKVPVSINVFD